MESSLERVQIPHTLNLTPSALEQVRKLLKEREHKGYVLRVFVSRGGCSGFQYGMGLDENIHENDLQFEFDNVGVVIDPVSINYLTGATIDFDHDLMGGGFRIENPNAVSSCGCGYSFRTENNQVPSNGNCC